MTNNIFQETNFACPTNIQGISFKHCAPLVVFYTTNNNKIIYGVKYDEFVVYNKNFDILDAFLLMFKVFFLINIEYPNKQVKTLLTCFECFFNIKQKNKKTTMVLNIINDYFCNDM